MNIRKAKQSDWQKVQHVAEVSWHDTYEGIIPRSVQDAFLERAYHEEIILKKMEYGILFVAEVEIDIVGFANVFMREDGEAELAAIYLLPEVQGKGIGTALLEAVKKSIFGVSNLYVYVEKENTNAIHFYESSRFVFVREFEEELFEHTFASVEYVLPLGGHE